MLSMTCHDESRAHSMRRTTKSSRVKERGALITELIVAMAIIVIALFPLAFSFAQEARFLRSCYNRAIATEIVDGEVEVLLDGEWRAFTEGTQDYTPHALAVTNLSSGKFQLTITNRRVRLEWLPSEKDLGGKVLREVEGPAKAGLNRALVNLAGGGGRGFGGGAGGGRGRGGAPAVAPLTVGDYTVTVDVAGQSLTKPARIRPRF